MKKRGKPKGAKPKTLQKGTVTKTRGKPKGNGKPKPEKKRGKPKGNGKMKTRGEPKGKILPKPISGLFNNVPDDCDYYSEIDGNKYVDFSICEYSCHKNCNNYFTRRKTFTKLKVKTRGGE